MSVTRCLCCGAPIDDDSTKELQSRWHTRCIKKFFGTTELPIIDITKDKLRELVSVSVGDGMAIPGVQKKMSLHLEKGSPSRLTLVGYPVGYILKPQAESYENLPEYEWLAMHIAQSAGVKVVPFALYDTGDSLVYLTKRIDRLTTPEGTSKYAMEDFCQLSGHLSEDKYKGSYELCIRTVRQFSEIPGLDVAEIFLRVVVSFLVGNSDMHLKNFSLIEQSPGTRKYQLSPAYDILPVGVVEPRDLDETALSLNAKKRSLSRADFLAFAKYCGLDERAGGKIINSICATCEKSINLVQDSFLSTRQKEAMANLIKARRGVLLA